MSDLLVDFCHDARGGIAFDYGLAVMALAAAMVEAIRLMGIDLSSTIDTLTGMLR
jgi:Flp pilus assembly pilin Flp